MTASEVALAPLQAMGAGGLGWGTRIGHEMRFGMRQECESPEGRASLDSAAGLMPAGPLPATHFATVTNDSGGSGSPDHTPSSPHRSSQPMQPTLQHMPQLTGREQATRRSNTAVPAPRRSKRKATGQSAASPKGRSRARPSTSVGDSQPVRTPQLQVPGAVVVAEPRPQLEAAAAGPAHLPGGHAAVLAASPNPTPPLELPGLDALDDVPGLDDLLLGLGDDDGLLGDPLAAPLPELVSPWQAPSRAATPHASLPAQHQQAQQLQAQAQQAAMLREQVRAQLRLAHPAGPTSQLASQLLAAQHGRAGAGSAPVMVPQAQPGGQYREEPRAALLRAESATTRRSQTSALEQLNSAPGASTALLGGGAPLHKGDVAPAGGRSRRRQPAVAAAGISAHAFQQQALATQAATASPMSAPTASLHTRGARLAVPLVAGRKGLASSSPSVDVHVQQPPQQQGPRAPSPPAQKPPVPQWLSRDPSRLLPVTRAHPSVPPAAAPAQHPVQSTLSAAASMVAASAGLAPAPAGRQLQGSADVHLLRCVFGEHMPARWCW